MLAARTPPARLAALALLLLLGMTAAQGRPGQESTTTAYSTTATPASATEEGQAPSGGKGKGGLLASAKAALGRASNATSNALGKVGRFATTRSTDEEVCYDVLGCFSLKSPWVSLLRPFPKPSTPEEINTRFYLYTRESRGRYNVTTFPEISLEGSSFQRDRPTFFVVHGFSSDGNATWLSDLKDALLEKVDSNVFLVDWGNGASDGTYFQVAANTRIVGAELARLGTYLKEKHGAQAQDFHFYGHSLGSQISSYAARNITGVGRITAMDPAQPGFENLNPLVRIDPSDAKFVEAIHTNAKPTIPFLGFGMIRPVGHVDFYMNGGADQPNCEVPKLDTLKSFGDLAKIPVSVIGKLVSCSHGRSYEYVTEAIRSDCRMWGHKINLAQQILNIGSIGHLSVITTNGKCKTGECTPLGLDTLKYPSRGTFSVGTGPEKPYCVRENSDDGQDLEELSKLGALDRPQNPEEDANSMTEMSSGSVDTVETSKNSTDASSSKISSLVPKLG